jgi:hypothetical protein
MTYFIIAYGCAKAKTIGGQKLTIYHVEETKYRAFLSSDQDQLDRSES